MWLLQAQEGQEQQEVVLRLLTLHCSPRNHIPTRCPRAASGQRPALGAARPLPQGCSAVVLLWLGVALSTTLAGWGEGPRKQMPSFAGGMWRAEGGARSTGAGQQHRGSQLLGHGVGRPGHRTLQGNG